MLYHSRAKREREKRAQIAKLHDLSGRPTTKEHVRRLLRAEALWGTILRECLSAANQSGGRFAGAWAMQRLRARGVTSPNNLRTLSKIGLLKLLSTSRAGNRAYYSIPDPKGITRALNELNH